MTRWYDVARRHPCGVLLVVQLAAIVVYPFLDGSTLGRSLVSAIALVVLALAVWAVRATPALNWVAGLLGVVTERNSRSIHSDATPRLVRKLKHVLVSAAWQTTPKT